MISDLIRLGVARLSNQQLADLALQADQESRKARRAGDYATWRRRDRESRQLLELVE